MRYYHLSHIDLDGYAAQVVASCFIEDIHFYNSNYGEEIQERIKQIFAHIEKEKYQGEIVLLITDLNLTQTQCEYIEKKIYDVDNMSIKLLDHHISGLDVSKVYDWYYLDDKRCATKITYEYFSENFEYLNIDDKNWLEEYVKAVNAVDLWLEEDELFEFGKVCMQMINKAFELPKDMFAKEDVKYKHHLIKESTKYLNKENSYIALDEDIYFIKKRYLNTDDNSDTFDNIISKKILALLQEKKDFYCASYQGFKVLVSFKLSHISIIANHFLKHHNDVGFFINVSSKGHVSLRSNNLVDVSLVSKNYFGGGGHKNASGGVIKGFQNSFEYSKIKNQIQEILN